MSALGNFAKATFAAGVGLVLIVGGVITYGKKSGEAVLSEFFAKVAASTPAQIEAMVHPELAKKVDPQLLAAFLAAIPKRMGKFQSIRLNGFEYRDKVGLAGRVQHYEGTFAFEQGDLPMVIQFVEGKLTAVSVNNQTGNEIADSVAKLPDDPARYVERGAAFWRAALGGKHDEAFAMLHDNLQKQVGREEFGRMFGRIEGELGSLGSLDYEKSVPGEQPKSVKLVYRMSFSNGDTVKGHLVLVFDGLQTYLLGFQVPSQAG